MERERYSHMTIIVWHFAIFCSVTSAELSSLSVAESSLYYKPTVFCVNFTFNRP